MALRRRLRVVAAAAALAAAGGLLAGCGEQEVSAGRPGKEITPIDAAVVPPELLGLKVVQEDASAYVSEIDRSYVEQFSLYSIRAEELLEASLQLSKFSDDADYQSEAFRFSVVNRIGSSRAQQFRMGDTELWMSTGTKQQIAIWFRGPHMFVLSIRDDYVKPRALIREALRITP